MQEIDPIIYQNSVDGNETVTEPMDRKNYLAYGFGAPTLE